MAWSRRRACAGGCIGVVLALLLLVIAGWVWYQAERSRGDGGAAYANRLAYAARDRVQVGMTLAEVDDVLKDAEAHLECPKQHDSEYHLYLYGSPQLERSAGVFVPLDRLTDPPRVTSRSVIEQYDDRWGGFLSDYGRQMETFTHCTTRIR